MSCDTIIFDLDGTLVDSLPDVCAALNHVLFDAGYSTLNLSQVKSLIGHGVSYMLEQAFLIFDHKLHLEKIDQFVRQYLYYYKKNPVANTVVFPFVREVLTDLYSQGFKMGVCSNKPYQLFKLFLQSLKMDSYFSAIIGGDTFDFCKPDPRHIHFTLKKMEKTTIGAVMVGDSEVDVLAAKNSGIPIILISYEPLIDKYDSVDVIINNFSELPMALQKI